MKNGLIKKGSIIEITLNAKEAEKFLVAYYGIFKLKKEGEIDLPTQAIDAIGVVYDKITEFMNEHDLVNIKKDG